jgi:hypothetical protein
MFPKLKYTDITQNTDIQSWTVTEIIAKEIWKYDSCYTLIDYEIHIKTVNKYVVCVILISVLNMQLTYEWQSHSIKLHKSSH